MKSIMIKDGLSHLSYGMFLWCTDLTALTLSIAQTGIGGAAFYGCSDLTDIYFTGTEEEWNAISKSRANIPSTVTIHFNYVLESN